MTGMQERPLLLGHRGMRRRKVAENTPAAFEMALQYGCDGFEFDVRLTADGELVVCHNPKSKGLTLAKCNVAQLGHLAPFEDVLANFCKRAFLNIELKVAGLEREVLARLRDFTPERGCVISSFLPQVVLGLRQLSDGVQLGIIFDNKRTAWRDMPVDYVIPHRSLVTPPLIDEVHKSGKRIMSWTVNNKASMLRFANWGIDGIISDKPELLVKTLRPVAASAVSTQDQSA